MNWEQSSLLPMMLHHVQYAGTMMTSFNYIMIPTRGNWFQINPLEHEWMTRLCLVIRKLPNSDWCTASLATASKRGQLAVYYYIT